METQFKKEVSKQEEFEALKAAFNRGQKSQGELLEKIFALVKSSGSGYRYVRFNNGAWSNCWKRTPKEDKRLIDNMLPILEEATLANKIES
jgi:hypothetical protein